MGSPDYPLSRASSEEDTKSIKFVAKRVYRHLRRCLALASHSILGVLAATVSLYTGAECSTDRGLYVPGRVRTRYRTTGEHDFKAAVCKSPPGLPQPRTATLGIPEDPPTQASRASPAATQGGRSRHDVIPRAARLVRTPRRPCTRLSATLGPGSPDT